MFLISHKSDFLKIYKNYFLQPTESHLIQCENMKSLKQVQTISFECPMMQNRPIGLAKD